MSEGMDQLSAWVSAYRLAWEGAGTIVRNWLGHRDEPGTTTFEWQPLLRDGDRYALTATTHYLTDGPRTYSNLWVLSLAPDGRCSDFTEWWMRHPA